MNMLQHNYGLVINKTVLDVNQFSGLTEIKVFVSLILYCLMNIHKKKQNHIFTLQA